MLDPDQLVLDAKVSGSLQETLVLRGSVSQHRLLVLFAAEVLDHWPVPIQLERLNEMYPFIEGAVKRALTSRRFTHAGNILTGGGDAYVVILDWGDIAS